MAGQWWDLMAGHHKKSGEHLTASPLENRAFSRFQGAY